MTANEENELFQLISAVCDEVATEEQNQQLHDLLRDDPEARRAYLNYVDLNFELADEFSVGAGRAPLPIVHAPKRSRAGIYAAIAAIAVIAFLLVQLAAKPSSAPADVSAGTTPPSPSTTIGRILAVQDGAVTTEMAAAETIKIGQRLELTEKPLALEIGKTRIFAAGPGAMTIAATDKVLLESGRIVAISGEGASGFTVEAPNCTITDLGTVFTVESGPVGTSTQVLEGAVEVAYGSEIHSLLPGGHLFVSADQQSTTVNEGDLSAFRSVLELSAGGVTTDGNVTALPQPTGFLSDTIRIWPEEQSVTLEKPLPITFTAPGTYKKGFKQNGKLPKGSKVDAYMVFYRPHRRRNATRQSGTIQFPRPIMAVICHNYGLDASDPIFAEPRRPDKVLARTFNSDKDAVTIAPDRRTIHLNLSNNAAYSSEIRVLLEPAD